MESVVRNPSGLIGVGPFPCRAVVASVQNADPLSGYPSGVNYAVAISYTVNVQSTDGTVEQFVGAIPSVPRWPYPWLVEAFPVGAVLPAGIMDGVVYIDIREERWAAPCGWQPGQQPTTPPPTQTVTPLYPGLDITIPGVRTSA